MGPLRQDLDLVVGQSEVVIENQPGPTEDASWLPEGVAWDEDTERRGDPGKYLIHVTDSFFKSSFPFGSLRIYSILLLQQLTPKSQKQQIHAYTHSLSTYKCTVVSEAPSACMCTIWNTQLLWKKRERLVSHMGFSCLHSEETHMTPPTFHWPEWVTGS